MTPPFRVRAQSRPPLPPWRAWIPLEGIDTILALRKRLAVIVPSSLATTSWQLQLLGFPLLDQSPSSILDPVNDILELAATPRGARGISPRPRAAESAGIVSDDHGQDDDQDDDQDDNVGAHPREQDSASASSSSSSAPATAPPALVERLDAIHAICPTSRGPSRPNGQGLARTKARNARKRKKRRLEREAAMPSSLMSKTNGPKINTRLESAGKSPQVASAVEAQSSSSSPSLSLLSLSSSSPSSSSSESESSDSNSESSGTGSSDSQSDSDSDSSDGSDPSHVVKVPPIAAVPLIGPVQPQPLPDQQQQQHQPQNVVPKKRKRSQHYSFVGPSDDSSMRRTLQGSITTSCRRSASPRYTPQSPTMPPIVDVQDPTYVPLPASPPLQRTDPAPAPSQRPSHTIPTNIIITGVDVESQHWVPGKIGWHGVQLSKNRGKWKKKKKKLKMNPSGYNNSSHQNQNSMYVMGQLRGSGLGSWAIDEYDQGDDDMYNYNDDHDDQGEEEHEGIDGGDDQFEDVGDDTMQTAQEDEDRDVVQGDANHGIKSSMYLHPDNLDATWSRSKPINKSQLAIGDFVMVKYLELSTSSFTPELCTLMGVVKMCSTDSIVFRLHPDFMVKMFMDFAGNGDGFFYDDIDELLDWQMSGGADDMDRSVKLSRWHRQYLKDCQRLLYQQGQLDRLKEAYPNDGDGVEKGCKRLEMIEISEVRKVEAALFPS